MRSPSGTLCVGTTISGRYLVEATLGGGGFGTVYKAAQLDSGRAVALKVLHRDLLTSEVAVGRFHREAHLAKQLQHPNTVQLHDFGQTGEGLLYIAYQLLEGRTLSQLVATESPLTPRRVASIACQVLESLSEAHEKGIVHRDVKPDNIFLLDVRGERDFVKVLDFGIAKIVIEGGTVAETMLTTAGDVIGTPSYMAPEQVRGERVSPATDLYAVGLVMAEMLTGRPVMSGSRPIEICVAQASNDPVTLPMAVLASPLAEVIARATAKPPTDRYRSATEMLQHLVDVVRRAPLSALDERRLDPGLLAPPVRPPALVPTGHPTPPERRQGIPTSVKLAMVGVGGILLGLVVALTVVVGFLIARDRAGPRAAASPVAPVAPVEPLAPAALDPEAASRIEALNPISIQVRMLDAGWVLGPGSMDRRGTGRLRANWTVHKGVYLGEVRFEERQSAMVTRSERTANATYTAELIGSTKFLSVSITSTLASDQELTAEGRALVDAIVD